MNLVWPKKWLAKVQPKRLWACQYFHKPKRERENKCHSSQKGESTTQKNAKSQKGQIETPNQSQTQSIKCVNKAGEKKTVNYIFNPNEPF